MGEGGLCKQTIPLCYSTDVWLDDNEHLEGGLIMLLEILESEQRWSVLNQI